MEYFVAFAALAIFAIFVGFIAKRVVDRRKARQERKDNSGGGTYVPREREETPNDEFER